MKMTAAINLHKFGILPEDENNHVFTFVFENPIRLCEIKSVESSEVTYKGHRWSLVCIRKEDRFVGIYLKWRYTDGQSASNISVKAKYTLSVIHRYDYNETKCFASNQKFSTAQSLLGKSKLITLDDLLDQGQGYLDENGKRVILELTISRCTTRYEQVIDVSPRSRVKKNVSGYYFDTTTFILANSRWYLRIYPTKTNSNGLPAIYLYLATKAKGLSFELSFCLYLGDDKTEILSYNYGEGAKFDGFGKTLSQQLYNIEKIQQLTIGVEITLINIWKDMMVPLRTNGTGYRESYGSSQSSYQIHAGYGTQKASEAFQDYEGNYWKVDVDQHSDKLMAILDKGVHHYQQNKTKLLCWSMTLLSKDHDQAEDVDQSGEPVVGYFSNFIDEKGYRISFPLQISGMKMQGDPYTMGGTGVMLRINLISLQTLPVGMRSIPRFDYQARHLLHARQLLHENYSNLANMREMAASRASLSFLDVSREVNSETSSQSGALSSRLQLYTSYDSLDALSTGDMKTFEEDHCKCFFTEFLRNMTILDKLDDTQQPYITGRDSFQSAHEGVSNDIGITMKENQLLLNEAYPLPADNDNQGEMVMTLIKLLKQRLPFRISDVLTFGSLGSGTATRNRMDIDLIFFSPDLPSEGQSLWMASLLEALQSILMKACNNSDSLISLPNCKDFFQTGYALQFTCDGVDVDIMLSYDWDTNESKLGGYNSLYKYTCMAKSLRERQWFALASAKLQKKFISEQPDEVKEIIRVVKHWRNCIQWKKLIFRPSSYLLSLLIIKATEQSKTGSNIKKVLQKIGSYLASPELRISWHACYAPDEYPIEFDPPSPVIRDPANPGVNVAETLPYWGQFRTEYAKWLKSLGLMPSDT